MMFGSTRNHCYNTTPRVPQPYFQWVRKQYIWTSNFKFWSPRRFAKTSANPELQIVGRFELQCWRQRSYYSRCPTGNNPSKSHRNKIDHSTSQVDYQALVILAGPWPKAPSPTLLPGGEGSYSPTYEVPSEGKHTFYYLELQLESKLSKQLHQLSDIVDRNGGGLRYHWSGVREIKAPEDRDFWREQFLPRHVQQQRRFEGPRQKQPWVKRPVQTMFKAPPIRRFKTKEEMEDLESLTSSMIANRGTRCNSSSASEYSGYSRPHSSLSQHSMKSQRSWYSNFPGALRIKTEVKSFSIYIQWFWTYFFSGKTRSRRGWWWWWRWWRFL